MRQAYQPALYTDRNMWQVWVFVGRLELKIPLERPRNRWKGKIRVDLKEIGCECVY